MSESGGVHRMAAEIRFDEDRSGIDQVGSHSIHHYWHLLAPHFREVLMSPQRRFDDGGVAWSWRESDESKAATVSELGELRKRLETANRTFADRPDSDDDTSENNSIASLEQIRDRMNQMTAALIAKPDAELRRFVARTESGPMLHSWGASTPAQPYNPDAHECEISGSVIVGEEPAAGYEVVLENRKGLRIARQVSEGEGRFCFPKIGPGEYRVRVVSDRVRFPLSGLTSTVERSSITGLELRSTSSPEAPPKPEPPVAEATPLEKVDTSVRRPQRWKIALIGLAVVLAIGGLLYAWKQQRPSPALAEPFRNSSGPSVQTAPGKTRQKNSVSSGDAFSKNLGEASGSPSEGFRRDRTVTLSRSSNSSASSSPPSPRSHETERAHTKAPPFDGFDLPSDTAPAKKPETIKGPPPPSAGGLNSPSGQGALTESGPDAGKESAGDGAGKDGPPSSDQAPPAAPGAINGATSAAAGKKSNASAATSSDAKSENNATLKSVAGESEEAKPASPAKPTTSPTSAAAAAVVPTPANAHIHMPEAPSETSDAEKEKEKPTSETGDPSAPESKERAKPATHRQAKPVTPEPAPQPKPDAEKPSDEQSSGSPSNAASQPRPQAAPKLKPSATVSSPSSVEKDSASKASAAMQASASPGAATPSPSSASSPVASSTSAKSATPQDASDSGAAKSEKKPRDQNRESSSESEGIHSTPTAELVATIAAAPTNDLARESLSMQGTIRSSAWQLRLIDDSILPTQPVRIGEEDTAEAMRAQMLRERKKQLPETLAHPVVHCGYTIDLPSGSTKARWQAVAEAPGIETTLLGDRAEICWIGQLPAKETEYRLSREDGYELASFRVDAKGNGLMKTATHVRRHFWIGIERASEDRAKVTVTEWADRFAWDRLPGSSVQTSWTRDMRWHAGKGDRIDFGGENPNGQPSLIWLAYVDHQTGWALSSEVEQTSGGPEAGR